MKSVTAAECAALAAFRILDQGDRVGAIVFGDETIAEFRPKRSRNTLHAFLMALSEANRQLKADAPVVAPMPLNHVLHQVARIAPRDHLILVFSDFDEIDETTHRLVAGISRHNDLVMALVYDPYAENLPKGMRVVVSDGALQAEIDTGDKTVHSQLSDMARGRLAEILDWQRRYGFPVLPLSAGADSTEQMSYLMGLAGKRS